MLNQNTLKLLLAASLFLWGCPTEDGEQVQESIKQAATIDVDGFVLMMRDDNSSAALNLIDPTTGLASPFELPIQPRSGRAAFSLSPDGQSVATVEPNGSVLVSKFAIDADTDLPTFERVAYWEMVGEEAIRFSFEPGIWVGSKSVYNANTGASFPCEIRDSTELQTATSECAEIIRRASALTVDEQFGYDLTHLPSGTRLAPGAMQNELRPTEGVQMRLPDGRLAILQAGVNGQYVSREAAGFSNVYKVLTSTTTPGLTDGYDVVAAFRNRKWDNEPLWDLSTVLRPYMNKGDGRRFAPLGFLQTGEVVYGISSWTISFSSIAGESVFGVGEIKNALFENVIHTAIVAIDKDGKTRAFEWEREKGGVLPNFSNAGGWTGLYPPLTHHGLALIGDESWLLPGDDNLHWVGYLDGAKTEIPQAGVMSMDSKWTVFSVSHSDKPPTLCFRPVRSKAERTCIPQPTVGGPVSILAQGIRKTTGLPVVTTLSVPAAWPGAQVTIFGSRFGTQGTVTLAGAAIADEDVLSWTNHAIVFRTPLNMSDSGMVAVQTADGESEAAGARLYRTELVETPFSNLKRGPHAVGQGLNVVDLGQVVFDSSNLSLIRLSSESRTEDGQYVVSIQSPGNRFLRITNGDLETEIHFQSEPRSADSSLWQPIDYLVDDELTESKSFFTHLAGDLVEAPGRVHPILTEGFVMLKRVAPRGAGLAQRYGLPDQWRTHGDTTLVRNGNAIGRLMGYGEDALDIWGTPMFGEPEFALGSGAADFDFAGDTVLEVGAQNDGNGTSARFRFRSDLGLTPGADVLISAETGRDGTVLDAPISLQRAGEDVFLVFERSNNSPDHTHLITSTQMLEQDIAASPGMVLPYRVYGDGSVAVIYSQGDATMKRLDIASGMPAWSVVPTQGDAGKVISTYHDPSDGSLYAIDADGVIQRATQASGWSDWEPFDPNVQTAAGIVVTPRNLGRMADGRWLMGADVTHADGGPWVFGKTIYLVGPEAP